MTEYEMIRSRAEAQAIACHGMTEDQVRISRDMGITLCGTCGLTPERVWFLTRNMRLKENGGDR